MSDWTNTPESSNVNRFRFDEATQVLMVEFNNGAIYEYYDVPEHVYDGMRAADSKGKYLYECVKGYYRYARQ